MTQEDKQLLLKDLCARLPYGVKVKYLYWDINKGYEYPIAMVLDTINSDGYIRFHGDIAEGEGRGMITQYPPYLRSMSSMTKEELKELNEKYRNIAYFFIQEPPYYYGLQAQHSDIGSIEISEFSEIYDWLNEHHFDFRCLIEKGLALEAPADMYKNE